MGYTVYEDFPPIVTKYENFDSLGFPEIIQEDLDQTPII